MVFNVNYGPTMARAKKSSIASRKSPDKGCVLSRVVFICLYCVKSRILYTGCHTPSIHSYIAKADLTPFLRVADELNTEMVWNKASSVYET
jgi:hypothetical protein